MKIYHKFLLYQNKLLKPYVRILLGLVEALTYLASLSLIVGVVYEHGFPLSIDEVANLQTLYKTVWIIFLIDVTLHISLEYRNTKKQYRRLAWILSGLLYLTLVPVIFHRPEEEGAILHIWEFLHGKFYHLLLLLVLSFLNLSNGLVRLLGRHFVQNGKDSVISTNASHYFEVNRDATEITFDVKSKTHYSAKGSEAKQLVDASALHGKWYHLGRLFIYRYQCRMRYRPGTGRRVYYIHHFGISCHYPVDSDWRIGSDDINQFLRHVLHGEYLHLQPACCA